MSIKAGKRKPDAVVVTDCRGRKKHLVPGAVRATTRRAGFVEIGETVYSVRCVSGLDTLEFVQPGPKGQPLPQWTAAGRAAALSRCSCDDYRLYGRRGPCKHLGASRAIQAAAQIHDDSTPAAIETAWEL